MEVNIQTKFHPETNPEGNAFNIIAEIPGSDLANEVVIMGAHFDTYPYATGATDNTTGSAAMIEAVRVIQKLGLKPRRTIRLALWAAEEQGLLGSREYVAAPLLRRQDEDRRSPATKTSQAYFNLDNGTGRILGIWGQNNTGAMKNFRSSGAGAQGPRLEEREPALGERRPTTARSKRRASRVSSSFRNASNTTRARTTRTWTRSTTCRRDDVIQQGAVAAVFAWHAANTPEKFPRKSAR